MASVIRPSLSLGLSLGRATSACIEPSMSRASGGSSSVLRLSSSFGRLAPFTSTSISRAGPPDAEPSLNTTAEGSTSASTSPSASASSSSSSSPFAGASSTSSSARSGRPTSPGPNTSPPGPLAGRNRSPPRDRVGSLQSSRVIPMDISSLSFPRPSPTTSSPPYSSGGGAGSSLLPPSQSSTAPAPTDPDAWWPLLLAPSASSSGSGGASAPAPRLEPPNNQFAGRSLGVYGRDDVLGQYRRLQGLLSRTGLKRDVRRAEFYEKASDKRRRLESARHRRRFQEMVREKVQTVQMIRNRG